MKKIIILSVLAINLNADMSNFDKLKAASLDMWDATKGIALDLKKEYYDDKNETKEADSDYYSAIGSEIDADINKTIRVKRSFSNCKSPEEKEVSEFEGSSWSWAKLERYIKMTGEFKE